MCFDLDLHPLRVFSTTAEQVAKANHSRLLDRHNNAVEARSRALSAGILHWLERYARRALREVKEQGTLSVAKSHWIAKKIPENLTSQERDLFELLEKYGLQELQSAGAKAASSVGVSRWKVSPGIIDEVSDDIASKVKLLVRETEAQIRDSLQRLIRESMGEIPTPSGAELARRIARQWFGPPGDRATIRGTAEERRVTADWRRTQEQLDAGGREYLFSFARARTIARTEVAQVRVAGAAAAYADVGVKTVRWIAYPNDGRSGAREHWRMNNKTISVEAMSGDDESQWFELPSGIMTPYPCWWGLPAGESVNCRCGLIVA